MSRATEKDLFGQRVRAIRLDCGLSQEDLAGFLGVSRQVVNQYLQSWRAQDWVALGRGSVTIRNEDAMRKAARPA